MNILISKHFFFVSEVVKITVEMGYVSHTYFNNEHFCYIFLFLAILFVPFLMCYLRVE